MGRNKTWINLSVSRRKVTRANMLSIPKKNEERMERPKGKRK